MTAMNQTFKDIIYQEDNHHQQMVGWRSKYIIVELSDAERNTGGVLKTTTKTAFECFAGGINIQMEAERDMTDDSDRCRRSSKLPYRSEKMS